jgi:hypothetical protein
MGGGWVWHLANVRGGPSDDYQTMIYLKLYSETMFAAVMKFQFRVIKKPGAHFFDMVCSAHARVTQDMGDGTIGGRDFEIKLRNPKRTWPICTVFTHRSAIAARNRTGPRGPTGVGLPAPRLRPFPHRRSFHREKKSLNERP